MKKLLNPIEFYNDRKLLIVNLIIFVIGTLISGFLKIRFDGVIDFHPSTEINFIQTFIDNIVNIITLIISYFILGKIINRKTRIIDILNMVFLSRIPYYLLSFTNIGDIQSKSSNSIMNKVVSNELDFSFFELANTLVFAFLAIAMMIYSIVLLYQGFKTSTNMKTIKNSAFFFLTFLLVIVVTSIILKQF